MKKIIVLVLSLCTMAISAQTRRPAAKGKIRTTQTARKPQSTFVKEGYKFDLPAASMYIDGDVIELPIRLSDAQIYEFEAGYISALCAAYAEALSRDEVTMDDIPSLPKKYQTNFYDQRKAYLSAESIQRSISEVYEDGENQFDILKADAFDGIKTTYYDDYDSGYRRLLEVLKKISDVQLTKSRLSLIKNLIGNLERLGIVHILVNDKTMSSWVDPYAE